MKRKLLLLSVQTLFSLVTFAQANRNYGVKELNGVWYNADDTAHYTIYKDGRFISLFYRDNGNGFYFSLIDKCGFISLKGSADSPIKNYGNPELDWFYWGGILYRFNFENPNKIGGSMELVSSNVFHYNKVKVLPKEYINGLFKQGVKDHQNYIREFLNLNLTSIKKTKSTIYYTPIHSTKYYLILGDPVEILERKGVWLRIRYYGGKIIEGWIKKSDIE